MTQDKNKPTPSEKPLQQWLVDVLTEIKAAYPLLKMDDETYRLYARELKALAQEVGRPRAGDAVQTAIRESRFYPTIADIRAAVPAERRMVEHTDANCPHCKGSPGWRWVETIENGEPRRRMKRCFCWRVEPASA